MQTPLLSRDTFRVDDLIEVMKNKQIYATLSDSSLTLARTVMLDFLSHHWSAAFSLLSSPVRNLLFNISIKNRMLSSICGRMQAMLECIDRNRNITFQFGDIMSVRDRLASELDFLKNRTLCGEFLTRCWDTKFGEA
jgi:hypothetical protein